MWNIVYKTLAAVIIAGLMVWVLSSSVGKAYAQECVTPFMMEQQLTLNPMSASTGLFARVNDPDEVMSIKENLLNYGMISSIESAQWKSIDIYDAKPDVGRDGYVFVVLYNEFDCVVTAFWDNIENVMKYIDTRGI